MKRKSLIFIFIVLFISYGFSQETNSETRKDIKISLFPDSILNYGLTFLNTPYCYGASGPKTFDCSGFTRYVFQHFGYNLDHRALSQANNSAYVSKMNLQKGDLVFFSSRSSRGAVGHVGIVLQRKENGEFDFLHASTNQGVTVSSSDQPYYAARFLRGGRIVEGVYPLTVEDLEYKEFLQNQSKNSANTTTTYQFHVVKKGDNLSKIAEQYDVPIETLKQLNGLKNNKIKKGMKLKISESVPTFSVENQLNKETLPNVESARTNIASTDLVNSKHRVEAGETLYSIANANNTTIDEIRKLNNLNSDNLSLGQVLVLNKVEEPAVEEEKTTTAVDNNVAKSSSADDLIAKLHALSDSKKVKSSKSTVAEQPENTVEKVVYTPPQKHKVKKGETLSKIADDNHISLNELKKLNHLSSSKIKPGQNLVVKEGKKTIKTETVKPVLVEETPNQKVVDKQQVETKSVELSKDAENPIAENNPIKHRVQKGETLYEIAKANNLSVAELKQINNLSSNTLKYDQVLILKKGNEKSDIAENTKSKNDDVVQSNLPEAKPAKNEPVNNVAENKAIKHKVQKGETLYDIARDNNMSVDELKQLNNISSDKIQLGQVLTLKKGEVPTKTQQVSTEKKKNEKSGVTTHIVKNGESLYSIRKKYGCKLDQLKKWNNLTVENLKIGQKLVIYQ